MTTTITARGLLTKIADLYEAKPQAWTQKAFARVKRGGNAIGPMEERAQCWCIEGAIQRFSGDGPETLDVRTEARERIGVVIKGWLIPSFNDHPQTQLVDVVRVLRRAAA